MDDRFKRYREGLSDPASHHYLIVASPDDLSPRPRGIRCLTAGTLTVVDEDGVSIPYPLTAGETLPFRAVKATDTGSGSFVAWT